MLRPCNDISDAFLAKITEALFCKLPNEIEVPICHCMHASLQQVYYRYTITPPPPSVLFSSISYVVIVGEWMQTMIGA